MASIVIGMVATIMVAVIGFLGIWLTVRASRNTAAEERQQQAIINLARQQQDIREQDLRNFTEQIREVRANQADNLQLVDQLRTENRKIRRFLSLAIGEIRDLRHTMRANGVDAGPLNAELGEVWFQIETTEQDGEAT